MWGERARVGPGPGCADALDRVVSRAKPVTLAEVAPGRCKAQYERRAGIVITRCHWGLSGWGAPPLRSAWSSPGLKLDVPARWRAGFVEHAARDARRPRDRRLSLCNGLRHSRPRLLGQGTHRCEPGAAEAARDVGVGRGPVASVAVGLVCAQVGDAAHSQALVRVDHAVDPHQPVVVLAVVGRRLERQEKEGCHVAAFFRTRCCQTLLPDMAPTIW
eukprot:scaffold24335_cov65-Phaeocystis_antarctica.AAC.3